MAFKRIFLGKKKSQPDTPSEAAISLAASRNPRKKSGAWFKRRGSKKGEDIEGTAFYLSESPPSDPQSPSETSMQSVEVSLLGMNQSDQSVKNQSENHRISFPRTDSTSYHHHCLSLSRISLSTRSKTNVRLPKRIAKRESKFRRSNR